MIVNKQVMASQNPGEYSSSSLSRYDFKSRTAYDLSRSCNAGTRRESKIQTVKKI